MEFGKKTIVIFDAGRPIEGEKLMASIMGSDIAGSLMISEGSAGLLNLLRRVPEILMVTPCIRGKSAVESARILKKRSPDAQIVVLYLVGAGSLELSDFTAGKNSLADRNAEPAAPSHPGKNLFTELTDRERQIMHHLARGKRYLEIASLLGISFETVKSHSKNICRKLGARNRTEAIAMYYNIISAPGENLSKGSRLLAARS